MLILQTGLLFYNVHRWAIHFTSVGDEHIGHRMQWPPCGKLPLPLTDCLINGPSWWWLWVTLQSKWGQLRSQWAGEEGAATTSKSEHRSLLIPPVDAAVFSLNSWHRWWEHFIIFQNDIKDLSEVLTVCCFLSLFLYCCLTQVGIWRLDQCPH